MKRQGSRRLRPAARPDPVDQPPRAARRRSTDASAKAERRTTRRRLRIAHVAPVATTIPPPKSGSVETMTSLLTDGLVARGHDVTLFATADSKTTAKLESLYPRGYWHDLSMWPWELYEMLNLAAAVERADEFDVIHYEAAYYPMSLAFTRLSPTPILQTLHHSPGAAEVKLWKRYPEAPFVAISNEQARLLSGLNVVATVLHGIDTESFKFRQKPEDYLLFLGRFTEGKGVLQAIEIAKRVGMRLILAAAEEQYYREKVAPHVDGRRIVYYGEADFPAKVRLYGGARALLYPIQAREPFGLVLAEAMACGTPVAALDRGAVREVVDDGVTGVVYHDLEQMVNELPRALGLDRRRVRERAVARFGVARMVDGYLDAYNHVIEARRVRQR
jgi:glycosyltransferase involved in cell wall biosynthesis